MKFHDIKRYTRQRLQYYAEMFAMVIGENLHDAGNPDLKNPDYEA